MAVGRGHTGYGWPVLTGERDGNQPRLRVFRIPGCSRAIPLRDGSVGFILIHFALWWHETIHPLDIGIQDDWGWADRDVRGNSGVKSEHAGGKAMDLDATLHPRGVALQHVFTRKQIVAIRRRIRMRLYGGVLGWGGDFHTVVDGMHVEITSGVTLSMCERAAKRLMLTPRGRRVLQANPGVKAVILS